MRKTFISFLTVFSMMVTALTPFVSGAEETVFEYNSRLYYRDGDSSTKLLVETDGTPLETETLKDMAGIQRIDAMDPAMNSLCDFSLDSTENKYLVSVDSEVGLVAAGRTLMQQHEYVQSVYIVEEICYSPYEWLYGFIAEPVDSSVDLLTISIPELEGFEVTYLDYAGVYSYTLSEQDTNFINKMESENLSSDYEKYLYMADYAEAVLRNHEDILKSVKVDGVITEIALFGITSATPIWQTAGDHNADGEVNSNDAADLLVQAAQDGVAEAAETTVSPDSDVNLDGVADATDAAYILQYSALKGSGADADWVEILKK